MSPQTSSQPSDVLPAPLRAYPSKLFVEATTFCNLRCPMCVKQSADSNIIDADMTEETFSALEPVFPHLEALLLNGIGESLMHPHLLDFIHRARRAMPEKSWIGFQSNGLLLDRQWARDLVASGLDRLCLSVDGVKPDTFSKVREGEDLSDMEKAFGFLADARKRQPDTRLKVGVEFVLMQENKQQLLDTLRWVADRGADFMLVTQASAYDDSAMDQLAYDNSTDEAVKIFTYWRDRIADLGLDVRDYNSRWEMGRFLPGLDPKLVRMMELVDQMRADARKKDVFLDVPRLLERGADKAEQLQALFDEAEQLAKRSGCRTEFAGRCSPPRSQMRFRGRRWRLHLLGRRSASLLFPLASIPLFYQRLGSADQTQGLRQRQRTAVAGYLERRGFSQLSRKCPQIRLSLLQQLRRCPLRSAAG